MAVTAVCHKILSFSVGCVKRPVGVTMTRGTHSHVLPRTMHDTRASSSSTVSQHEVDKFRALAAQWWDPSGDFKALHSFNALRVPLVRDGILQTKRVPKEIANSPKPLKDYNIIDVGCGGGVLSEPLHRLGANVTGIDPAEECITVAREHVAKDPSLSKLTYLQESVEDHMVKNSGGYDAVVLSEVAEHANDWKLLIDNCLSLLKMEGSIFVTTINQTYSAWLLAILVAENVLRVVPPGTHDYNKLIKPEDLEHHLTSGGCQTHLVHGMLYNPFNNTWHWSKDTSINYAIHAVKTQ